MDLEKALIRQSRECIKAHSLDDLKSLCKRADVLSREGACSIVTLYKLLMNNTCIYGTQEMVVWLMEVFFEYFAPIDRMAMRQLFFYSKQLTKRNKNVDTRWFNDFVLPLVRA